MALGEIFGGIMGLFRNDVLGGLLTKEAKGEAIRAAETALAGMADSIRGTGAAKNAVSRALGATGQRASLGYGLMRKQLGSIWGSTEQFGRGMALRRLLESDTLDEAVRKELITATGWNPQNPKGVVELAKAYDQAISKLTADNATDKMRAVANALSASAKNYTTGMRVGIIGTGALIGGGALYALGSVRRGDYGGAAIGAGIAGLGAWAALRAGVGAGLTGVMAAYEKQLISARNAAIANAEPFQDLYKLYPAPPAPGTP